MGYITPAKAEDRALRKILEGTASHTGKEFFQALVKNLAEALGTRGAWVTEYLQEKDTLHALAFWLDGKFVEDYELQIPGSPCERVLRQKQMVHVPDKLLELYPRDPDIASLDAVSYLGTPLLDPEGTLLGHLAVLGTRPMPNEASNVDLFNIFANRATSELQRLNAETRLQEQLAAPSSDHENTIIEDDQQQHQSNQR